MITVIKYEQIKLAGTEIAVQTPDFFIMTMSRAFGAFPIELEKKNIERLEGMAATWSDVSNNPYDQLIRAIRRYGNIRVWAEYPTDSQSVEDSRRDDV